MCLLFNPNAQGKLKSLVFKDKEVITCWKNVEVGVVVRHIFSPYRKTFIRTENGFFISDRLTKDYKFEVECGPVEPCTNLTGNSKTIYEINKGIHVYYTKERAESCVSCDNITIAVKCYKEDLVAISPKKFAEAVFMKVKLSPKTIKKYKTELKVKNLKKRILKSK